jgi:hypothetical protein
MRLEIKMNGFSIDKEMEQTNPEESSMALGS